MKSLQIILIAFVSLFQYSFAQQSNSDEIIVKALSDEMNRSVTDLKLNNSNAPFFVANYFCDGTVYYANASLGTIIQSRENPIRNGAFRLLVGDYKVTDENFQEAARSYTGYQQLSPPAENDYLAFRRYYWSMIDKAYKSSIEKYMQKLTVMKQQNIDEKTRVDDFCKMPSLIMKEQMAFAKINTTMWAKYIKELSLVFKQYPELQSSSVQVFAVNAINYMVNTEGAVVKTPVTVAALAINVATQAADGEKLNDHILRYYSPCTDMPSLQSLLADVDKMAAQLNDRRNAPEIADSYQGTVVFEGDALAELLNIKFFGRNGLLTNREPIYAVASTKAMTNKIENKLDKRLCNENITIVAQSDIKRMGDCPLIGSFAVDAEGVKPVANLMLVENGILKTLLSDRVPTKGVAVSNGHMRFGMFGSFSKAPGVIKVNFNNGQDYLALLKSVSAETTKNGLKHYYIIRKLETSNFAKYFTAGNSDMPKPIAIYEVTAATGAERMIRCATISDFPMLSFKYVLGATSEQVPYNFLTNQQVPVSFVVPKAMAFNDISLEKDNSPKAKLPVVPSPLELVSK